jgi:hypothetical protein
MSAAVLLAVRCSKLGGFCCINALQLPSMQVALALCATYSVTDKMHPVSSLLHAAAS